ncbi:MAG: translocation/assembly module TamB domain-containing protein [Bacteroidetes bacterium]|nr:translocation/assembly module TamB domain-containing protein [Bacteroidota bacterium]
MKRFFKILGYGIGGILLLLLLSIWLLSMEKYQNIAVKRVAKYLSDKLHTNVQVAHVKFSFFTNFNIEGVFIEDQSKDTLAYLGNLQIHSTDLIRAYWNEESPTFKNIHIEDGFVYLNRAAKDSTWNYDFIADALSGGGAEPSSANQASKPEIESPSEPLRDLPLELKKLTCKNVLFFMDDAWVGRDMRFKVGTLHLDIDQIALAKKEVGIHKLIIDQADILIKEYQGGKPKDLSPDDTTEWGTPFNPDRFAFSMKAFTLSNSRFAYQDGDIQSVKGAFDETNLQMEDINMDLSDTKVVADTLFSNIIQLKVKERCGIAVNHLNAKLKLSQVQASLSEMKLQTNYSNLQDHFEMNYRNFHDFNDFISKVNMVSHLKESTISSLDIGYFATILNQYPIAVNVSGHINGTVDHLAANNLQLNARNSTFAGNVTVTGLPDIENTYFTADISKLITSGSDLNALVPQSKVDAIAWNELKRIEYSGKYSGKVDNFHTKGNVRTSLGDAYVDLNLNIAPKNPAYQGEIKTDHFNVGKLIRQNSIGHVSMDGKVNGSGFDLESINSKLNASISRIEIDNAVYENLTVNGIVSKKKFDGIFVSQDPNMAFNFNGILDISGKEPALNFNSRILRFDLKKLGITKESTIISCLASLNFRGNNIDNFLGDASLRNVLLVTQTQTLHIDSIHLNSTYLNNEKEIQLRSSIADADIKGKFNISQLSNAFQLYLCHYLPHYVQKPKSIINEQFTYSVNIKDANPLLEIFLPKLTEINGTTLSGNLNTFDKRFSLDAYIPAVEYDQLKVKDLYLVRTGEFSSFEMNVNSKDFMINEETIIPSFQINSSMANDTAVLEINTQSVNDIFGNASVKVKGSARDDKLFVKVLPSNISLRQTIWQIFSKQELVIGEEVSIEDLIMESGAQKITINTERQGTNNLITSIENLDLEGLSQYIDMAPTQFYGRLSGKVAVEDFMHNPVVRGKIFSTNELRIDQDTVGMVMVEASYDLQSKILSIDKNTSIDRKGDRAFVSGMIDLKDSTINVKATLKNTEIAFVNQFISDFVQNVRGKLTGNVVVSGKLPEPAISGTLQLKDAGMKVLLLGTSYQINEAKFTISNQKIEMNDVLVMDETEGGHSGILRGTILHKNFSDFYLNLRLDSKDLLCLNTKEWDSELFYGYVHANVSAVITGELNDLVMDVEATPLKGSKFYLPLGGSGDASKYEFVKFIELGRRQDEEVSKAGNYLKLTMNIAATPDIETFIVLDKNTGEEIIAKGAGEIKLVIDVGNTMEMFGKYEITEGKYLFKFRGVVNREFTIEEGSRITWTGDALAANLQVNAIYEVGKKLALFPLVSNIEMDETEKAEAKRTYKTLVPLSLTGSLSAPTIKFDILQPENKSLGTAGYTKLQQIRNDEKELFNQAGVLLLLGEFMASEGISQQSYSQGAVGTVSDLVSTAVSSEITNQFQSLTGLKNISLGVNYQTLSNDAIIANTNRNQFSFNVSANLLKNRVIVDFSNSVDVGKDATGNTTSNFNGDFKAQFLITNDGRFRANAYRTNNVDIGGSPFTRGGVGLSYKKVFNSFGDLFFSKKKEKNPPLIDTLNKVSKI